MVQSAERWEQIYRQVPLAAVPSHYSALAGSPSTLQYLLAVLRLTPRGGRALETGVGTGYSSVWLSQHDVRAEGVDCVPSLVERARQVNSVLGGSASFEVGDLFQLYEKNLPRWDVIHHEGVADHFSVPQIRAALAQQVASAGHVVFSVPSVHYPLEADFGDERLLPLDVWQWILEPFDVVDLSCYGDPKLGSRDRILCTLRGQTGRREAAGPHASGRAAVSDRCFGDRPYAE